MTTTSTSCAAVVVRAPGRRAGCTASTSGVSAARRALHLQAVAWESMSSTTAVRLACSTATARVRASVVFPLPPFCAMIDNRTSEMTSWDHDLLPHALAGLYDLDVFAFDDILPPAATAGKTDLGTVGRDGHHGPRVDHPGRADEGEPRAPGAAVPPRRRGPRRSADAQRRRPSTRVHHRRRRAARREGAQSRHHARRNIGLAALAGERDRSQQGRRSPMRRRYGHRDSGCDSSP